MREEIWKDIPGFNGNYQASTSGRIRSVDRVMLVSNPMGRNSYSRVHKGVILNPIMKKGFKSVALYKDGVKTVRYAHVLVAMTFLENPNGCPYLKFKDGDKGNIDITNLEWTNGKYRGRSKK